MVYPAVDGLPWSVKLLLALERGEGSGRYRPATNRPAAGVQAAPFAHMPRRCSPRRRWKLFRHEFRTRYRTGSSCDG